jgi:vancomycin resistance protein VanJ
MAIPPKVVASKKKVSWTKPQISSIVFAVIYTVFLLWLRNATNKGPEYSWIVLANQYAPQIFWGIPSLLLILVAYLVRGKRRWLVATPLPSLAIVFISLMGVKAGAPIFRTNDGDSKSLLRVMTYNIAQGKQSNELIEVITHEDPDILLVQELDNNFERMIKEKFPKWNVRSDGEFLIATSLPFSSFQRVELPHLIDDPWKRPAYVRAVVRVGKFDVAVYNTHFSTPRPALAAMRARESGAIAQLESNGNTRLYQANVIAQALSKEKVPVLLGGDLNATEPSLACRQIVSAGMRDAFSEAGWGYGYTSGHALRYGMSFVRIDHVYVSAAWRVRSCYAGDASGSDHRPVIANLELQSR